MNIKLSRKSRNLFLCLRVDKPSDGKCLGSRILNESFKTQTQGKTPRQTGCQTGPGPGWRHCWDRDRDQWERGRRTCSKIALLLQLNKVSTHQPSSSLRRSYPAPTPCLRTSLRRRRIRLREALPTSFRKAERAEKIFFQGTAATN